MLQALQMILLVALSAVDEPPTYCMTIGAQQDWYEVGNFY